MNIEQQVKDAINEFGKEAYKRFLIEINIGVWANLKHNDQLVFWSEQKPEIVKLKLLPELFEHDVSFYGADAYFMWEISLSDKDKFIDATDNNDVLWALDSTNYDVRRKTSAALPFDLERAIAGDVVEINRLGKGWCFFKPYGYSINPDNNGNIEFYDASGYSTINPEKLRMKYPKAEK